METKLIGGQFKGVKKTDKDEKIYTFIASTSDPDRDGEVVNQTNWKLDNYKKNPIIGYQHKLYSTAFDPDDVIGKAVELYMEDNKLLVDVLFDVENDKAKKIASKIDRGFLSSVSVGYREIGEGHMGNKASGEDPNLRYLAGQELREISVVNIPANPNAELVKSLEEVKDMKVKDLIDLITKKNETINKENDSVETDNVDPEEQPAGEPLSTVKEEKQVKKTPDYLIEQERDLERITLLKFK